MLRHILIKKSLTLHSHKLCSNTSRNTRTRIRIKMEGIALDKCFYKEILMYRQCDMGVAR